MCLSMVLRAFAWHAILRAALPRAHVRLRDALQGTFIGVLMSATLPARLGEPSRAFVVARRIGSAREHLPVVLGTIVSQSLLNILALVVLGITMFSTVDVFSITTRSSPSRSRRSRWLPRCSSCRRCCARASRRARRARRRSCTRARAALVQLRGGLTVFRRPRLGAIATLAQLSAWVVQWLSCFVLLVALGLDDRAGLGAAAAVLFAVNVSAVLPVTPSNIGIFQAACLAVLAAYGVGYADALAYGIILQSVEIATAIVMGTPALVKEGLSWREVRLRAMHSLARRAHSPCSRSGAARRAKRSDVARRPIAVVHGMIAGSDVEWRWRCLMPGSTCCPAAMARCTAAGRRTSSGA